MAVPGTAQHNTRIRQNHLGPSTPPTSPGIRYTRPARSFDRAIFASRAVSASVLARECRDHLPGALEDSLMQFGLDYRPHNGFLAFGVGRVGHLAGPHPGGRATQVRVGGAAPEHGDHLYRLDAPAVPGGGFPLLGARTVPSGRRRRRRDLRPRGRGRCRCRAGRPRLSARGSAAPPGPAGSQRGGIAPRVPATGGRPRRCRSEDRSDGGRCPSPWEGGHQASGPGWNPPKTTSAGQRVMACACSGPHMGLGPSSSGL